MRSPTISLNVFDDDGVLTQFRHKLKLNYGPPPSHRGGGGFEDKDTSVCFCVCVFLNKHDPCGFTQDEAAGEKEKGKGS